MKNDLLTKAIRIASEIHEGQVDKSGSPYILHPLHVMSQFTDINDKIVAVLHDAIEDAGLNDVPARLETEGFPDELITDIKILTHKRGTPYEVYIDILSRYPRARRIKLADLKHNMDVSRLNPPLSEKDLQRVIKYGMAYNFLLWVLNPSKEDK
jgi:(p)ppGpp synthase/HD superfamily hydrolase